MPKFIAVKIHYDHRTRLPYHLKYSCVPTTEEYQEYLDFYESDKEGGNGFHECLNFALKNEHDEYKIYLSPTCLPAGKYADEEFVIFYFTYKSDYELSASLIGVHGCVHFLNMDGIYREEGTIPGIKDRLFYQATTTGQLGTLFSSPLPYDFREGEYTPAYQSWGNGLRYIKDEHAQKILIDAFAEADKKIKNASDSERIIIQDEIDVLNKISIKYFGKKLGVDGAENSAIHRPNFDIGYLGEKAVYEQELKLVKQLGLDSNSVEWLSQSVPTSVVDIKTVREKNGKIIEHFLEVKSSSMSYGENIYLSDRQIDFFVEKQDSTSLVIVNFEHSDASPTVRYLSFREIEDQFDFKPVKYKLLFKK